jgi:hypothetical protein
LKKKKRADKALADNAVKRVHKILGKDVQRDGDTENASSAMRVRQDDKKAKEQG